MRGMARASRRRYAGMEPGRPVGGTYYLYRTLRNLDLDGVLEKLIEQEQRGRVRRRHVTSSSSGSSATSSRTASTQLKKEIEAEIRRRLVADRGVEAMAKTLRKPLPEDVDFMHASREEMASLRKAIYPLTRKLAARLAAQAPPRPQGPARLPSHRPPFAQLRRRARRAEVPQPAPSQARDLGHRRHLRFGGRVRPLHAAPRLRDLGPVLEGPLVRVHRRTRRGHPASSRASTTSTRPSTGSTPKPTSCGSTVTPTTAMPSRCSGRTLRQGHRASTHRS